MQEYIFTSVDKEFQPFIKQLQSLKNDGIIISYYLNPYLVYGQHELKIKGEDSIELNTLIKEIEKFIFEK